MCSRLKIALDYDETYTEDPIMWGLFIGLAKQRGHEVKFVTYRDSRWTTQNDDIILSAHNEDIDIEFTQGNQKCNFYDADIWIDDRPETIPCASLLGGMYDGCLVNNDMESPRGSPK